MLPERVRTVAHRQRVSSRPYTQTVADVPCAGRQVTMKWHVHRFRCSNSACSLRNCTERFPTHLRPWAPKTLRL